LSFFNELKRRNVLRVGAAYIVTGWLVIQVVETIFPAFGFSDAAVRIVVITFAIGLIPALIFSWAYEITPEGLRKEKDVGDVASFTHSTGKKLDRIIMVVLALALGYFAFDKFVLSQSREASIADSARQQGRTEVLVESYGDQSIAVLPFVDMSPQGDQEYFSDGISEELLNLLAKIPQLRVISRSSAFSYKGKDIRLAEVARELNVAHILEGSVRKAGNQVRITAQLIEARSDTHLWSETYDRPLDDIFAVQDDISAKIVEQLKIKLLGIAPSAQKTDTAAYSLFLRARYLRRQNSEDSMEEAMKLFEQVLEIDPSYLPAVDDLITVYINQAHTGYRPFKDGYELARKLTLEGMEMDPEFARMYIQLGWIQMFFDSDMTAAAKSYQRGLELDSTNNASLGDTSSFLMLLGRLEESMTLHEFTNKRDPVHPVGNANAGQGYARLGRFKEAVAKYRKTLELSPEYHSIHYYLSMALLGIGEHDAALAELELEPLPALQLAGRAVVYYAMGNSLESDQTLQLLIDDYAEDWSYFVALVFAYRGELDEAFKWIDIALEKGSSDVGEIHVDIWFSNLHQDPRWTKLLESLGKSPEQLGAIQFELDLPGLIN
jgi:TolB-like protein/lipoprotein NlpI